MIEQGEYNLKHVALLRRVIMEERSGTASFEGLGWTATIVFERGAMTEDESASLVRVLQEPVFRFGWNDEVNLDDGTVFPTLPRHVFSRVVATLNLPTKRLIAYRQVFAKLPSVRVRYLMTFRFDHEYQMQFQALYRLALNGAGVSLDEYFASAASFAELRKRVNIVIAAYCMGDLLPVGKRQQTVVGIRASAASITDPEKANVVSRILARLRRGQKDDCENSGDGAPRFWKNHADQAYQR